MRMLAMKKPFFVLSCVVSLIMLFIFVVMPANTKNSVNLEFFMIIKDKSVPGDNSDKYDRAFLTWPGRRDRIEVYIARVPNHKIGTEEIKSVVIRKEKIYRQEDTPAVLEELLGLREKEKVTDYPVGYIYAASFALTDEGGKRFTTFAQKSMPRSFEVRFAGQKIAVVELVDPVPSRKFLMSLEETNEFRIKEIFSSIKEKVTWE